MAKVLVRIRRYSGPYASLNGDHLLNVSRRAILTASLTLGFQNQDEMKSAGGRAWFHRLLQGLAALNCLTSSRDGWGSHEFRDSLDGSEKGTQSFWQGMIFAKLVAARFLSIRWLANVDAMKRNGLITLGEDSKERGDLVGKCDGNEWHVVEAKGRSYPYSPEFVQEAKDQAANIVSVSGEKPVTHAACIASLWKDPIEVLLDDPPSEGEATLEFPSEAFWKHYYGGLIGYIHEFEETSTVTEAFRGMAFASLSPLFEGISEEVASAIGPLPTMIGLPTAILRNPSSAPGLVVEQLEGGVTVQGDGVMLLGPFGSSEKLTRE